MEAHESAALENFASMNERAKERARAGRAGAYMLHVVTVAAAKAARARRRTSLNIVAGGEGDGWSLCGSLFNGRGSRLVRARASPATARHRRVGQQEPLCLD